MHHNNTNNVTPPSLTQNYMRHFQIFDKNYSFLKKVSNVLDNKKGRLHLFEEPLNLHIIVC